MDSTLASIHDIQTNNFLTELSGGNDDAWIGGSQDANEVWMWSDGSEWNGFTNWLPGEPTGWNGEDFLVFNFRGPGLWNDLGDVSKGSRLCQYNPDP